MRSFQYFNSSFGPISAPIRDMTAEPQLVQSRGQKPGLPEPSGSGGVIQQISTEAALAQQSIKPGGDAGEPFRYGAALSIPIEVDVAVPIRRFRVRNLIALAEGQVIGSEWVEGEDMPMGARGAQLAWSEFEVVDQKLAVRITRLV
jgi:flagellar motor switch/type III secretory pathway protein FliN